MVLFVVLHMFFEAAGVTGYSISFSPAYLRLKLGKDDLDSSSDLHYYAAYNV